MRNSTPDQVSRDLGALAAEINGQVHRVTVKTTAELQAAVQRNASGRPGPNVITGHYRRSIGRVTLRTPAGAVGFVGTDAPQARRLEFGFHGTDSRGRSYRQPPYPHFGPALDQVAPLYAAAIAAIANPQTRDRYGAVG